MAKPRTPLFPVALLLTTAVLLSTAGQIAFVATFDDAAEGQVVYRQEANGIFAGGTGLYEKAIAINDPLLGSGVTALDTGPQSVTNSGPFVFRASRGNGTTGIYVGVPGTSGGDGGGGGGAFDGASAGLLLLASCVRRRLRRARGSGARIGS